MKNISLLCSRLLLAIALSGCGELFANESGMQTGNTRRLSWEKMNPQQKTYLLEKYRKELQYAISNIGKSFDEVDIGKIGALHGYEDVKLITPGLIAGKYETDYKNSYKAAEFYYQDYLAEKAFLEGKSWGSKHAWQGIGGDYRPFNTYMWVLKENGQFKKAVQHYPEYFDYYFLGRRYHGSRREQLRQLNDAMKYDAELKNTYDNFMREWDEMKASTDTIKIKPLDPAVQHHEWFYSDKQAEVLKALEYYHKHNVRFMLEKALKHTDPVIAAKAKTYLESPAKENTGDETKR